MIGQGGMGDIFKRLKKTVMPDKGICPNCHHSIYVHEVLFHCDNPEHSTEQQVFDIGAGRGTFPRQALCPICGKTSFTRICPKCKNIAKPLPYNFGFEHEKIISICGISGSGKSHFMAALHSQMVLRGSSFGITYDYQDDVGLGDGLGWGPDYIDPVTVENKVIDRTQREVKPLFVFIATRQDEENEAVAIHFRDIAGEHFNRVQSIQNEMPWLGYSEGLLILLDPEQFPTVRKKLITRPDYEKKNVPRARDLIKRIHTAYRQMTKKQIKKVDIPTAVAVNKIDMINRLEGLRLDQTLISGETQSGGFSESLHIHKRRRVLEPLVGKGPKWGDDIFNAMDTYFENWEIFAVAATGKSPERSQDGLYFPGGIKPIRVIEPFIWLLSRLDMVDILDD
jgi:hypothetical protein